MDMRVETVGNEIEDNGEQERSKYKFTLGARGATSGEGWSDEGCNLYQALFEAIRKQRKDQTLANDFESAFQIHMVAASESRPENEQGKREA